MNSLEKLSGIGERVEKLRIMHNESRQDVARVLFVSPSYVSRLLDDKVKWNIRHVRMAADHYHVTENYILYGNALESPEPDMAILHRNTLIEDLLVLESISRKEMLKTAAVILRYISDLIFKSLE